MLSKSATQQLQNIIRNQTLQTCSFNKICDEYYKNLINYNVAKGKMIRSQFVLTASGMEMNDTITRMMVSTELMHSGFLIADDVADNGVERHKAPCWHLRVGNHHANNDANFLVNLGLRAIQHDNFISILYNTTCLHSIVGQNVDLSPRNFFNSQVMTEYENLCLYKTGMYTFNYPVLAGLSAKGVKLTSELEEHCKKLAHSLGVVYQSHNDLSNLIVHGDGAASDIALCRPTWISAFAAQILPTEDILNRRSEAISECVRNHDIQNEFEYFARHHLSEAQAVAQRIDIACGYDDNVQTCVKMVQKLLDKEKTKWTLKDAPGNLLNWK